MLDCTYRVQIPHRLGRLAQVAGAIAQADGLIGDIVTISVGREHSIREITVMTTPSSAWLTRPVIR